MYLIYAWKIKFQYKLKKNGMEIDLTIDITKTIFKQYKFQHVQFKYVATHKVKIDCTSFKRGIDRLIR